MGKIVDIDRLKEFGIGVLDKAKANNNSLKAEDLKSLLIGARTLEGFVVAVNDDEIIVASGPIGDYSLRYGSKNEEVLKARVNDFIISNKYNGDWHWATIDDINKYITYSPSLRSAYFDSITNINNSGGSTTYIPLVYGSNGFIDEHFKEHYDGESVLISDTGGVNETIHYMHAAIIGIVPISNIDLTSLLVTKTDFIDFELSHSNILADLYATLHNADETNFTTSITRALSSIEQGAIIDCSYYNSANFPDGVTLTEPIVINYPVTIKFPEGKFTYSGEGAMFRINAKGVSIIGAGRVADLTDNSYGTRFIMDGAASDNGYHVLSTGVSKSLTIKDCSFYGRASSPNTTDGVGGIYIEKPTPASTGSGNNCSNIQIENVYIEGTKASGIYINTPILSRIADVRVTKAGTACVFIENGTSTLLENVYAVTSNFIGFHLKSMSYSSMINCCAEDCSLAYWIRSGRNISLFNPGFESLSSNKVPKAKIEIPSPTDSTYLTKDISTDSISFINGCGIVITGGWGISVMSPYGKVIGTASKAAYIKVLENNRSSSIANAYFSDKSNTTRLCDIYVDKDVKGLDLNYDIQSTTIADSNGVLARVVTDSANRGAICNKSASTFIHAGNDFVEDIKETAYTNDNKVIFISGTNNKVTYTAQYLLDGNEEITVLFKNTLNTAVSVTVTGTFDVNSLSLADSTLAIPKNTYGMVHLVKFHGDEELISCDYFSA